MTNDVALDMYSRPVHIIGLSLFLIPDMWCGPAHKLNNQTRHMTVSFPILGTGGVTLHIN